MVYFFIVIIGLAFGSFINAFVYRLNAQKPIFWDRSICPKCGHRLAAKDLVPVLSFIFLGGECRYCKNKISRQYPVVELLTAALLVLVYLFFSGDLFLTFGYAVISIFLLIIAVYDFKYYLVSDGVVIPAIIFALVFRLAAGEKIVSLLLGMAVGGGFFLLQYMISRGKWIGGGDIRLGVLAGAVLGWPGALWGLFLAYVMGAIAATPLLLLKKRGWKSEIPFGVFLAPAIFIVMIWGENIVNWYLNLSRWFIGLLT